MPTRHTLCVSCAPPEPVRRERITPLAESNWTGCGGQASFDSVTLAWLLDGVNRAPCFVCLRDAPMHRDGEKG